MPATASHSQHRHYRTLITLVVSMTGGTLLLYWMAQLSPVTPLRSRAGGGRAWSQISVRALPDHLPTGFYHYRIDASGRLFESQAWEAGRSGRNAPGTVHVLLSCRDAALRVTPPQTRTLTRILGYLRETHVIGLDQIYVEPPTTAAFGQPIRSPHLRKT